MSLPSDPRASTRLLQQALELGITYYDTADLYDHGENELAIGKAFHDRREQVFLATKVGNQWRPDGSGWDWNPRKEYILSAVEDSLRRLQTDYIDLYQLHGGTMEDPIDEAIEAFELLKAQGKIRAYGLSSIRPAVIREWVKRSQLSSVMIQYSLLDRRPEEDVLDLLHQNGIEVVVRGALAKGLLVDKVPKAYLGYESDIVAKAQQLIHKYSGPHRTPAQTALHFCLAHPAVTRIAAGIRTMAQLEENAGVVQALGLSEGEYERLKREIPALLY